MMIKMELFLVITIYSLIIGCATIPENYPPLENARSAYSKAEANPDVEANAPVALYEAKQALNKAVQSDNLEEKEHLSYIAEKHANLAMALAERKKAEKEIKHLEREKENIILESRRIEAEQAKKVAASRAREAQEATDRARRLENELAELKAKKTDLGIVLTLGDVLFATGRAELTSGAMLTIDKLASFLKKYPKRYVRIEGHTDDVGSDASNLDLSQRRAESVKMGLQFRGISSERITAVGFGEAYPVASNTTESGRQQNRRVEIVILDEEE